MDLKQTRQLGPNLKTPSRSEWGKEGLQIRYRIPPNGVQKTSKWGTENLEMMHRIPIKRAYQLPPTTCSWPNKKSFSISQNSFWDFEVWEIQHSRQIGQANLLVRSSSSRQCDQMATLFLNISKLTTIKISPITNFCQSWFSKSSIWPNNKEL